jgi:uncharacterized membrane protein YcaP (DUF421 family)
MEFIQMMTKLFIGFILLFFFIRIAGHKIIGQFTPFHFIAAIVLSELLGNAVYESSISIMEILLAIAFWGGLLFLIEFIFQKSLFLREKLEGDPAIVIRNGQIDYRQLKKSRMNINQLQSLLRQSEIFSIREVAFALIEPNGSISVLKKSAYQKTTLEDLKLPNHAVYLPVTLIRDGELMKENLQAANKDEQWLNNELKKKGIEKFEDVLFAEWLEGDGLFVNEKKGASKQEE